MNYWLCDYGEYEEEYYEEDDTVERYYFCRHPNGCGYCDKENKYNNSDEFCGLVESNN